MPRLSMRYTVSRTALVALLLGLAAAAQDKSVQLLPEKQHLYLGEAMGLNLLVTGDTAPGQPQFPALEDFHVRFLRSQAPSGERPTHVFQYDIVPRRTGTLTIPPVSVEVAGETISSSALSIEVLAPEETGMLRLETRLSKSKAYVGEALTLTVTWYCALPLQSVKAVDLQVPLLRDARFKTYFPRDQVDPNAASAVGVPVSDTRVIADRTEVERDGTRFAVMTFHRRLVPREAGRLSLDGGVVYCAALDDGTRARRAWNQYPSYFDNDFFDKDLSGDYVRHFAAAAPIALQVLPLPGTGVPAQFGGLVAENCQVEASLDQETVPAGAPVQLRFAVRADSDIEHIEALSLAGQAQLARDFDLPAGPPLGRIEQDAMVFTYSLRPLHTNIAEVPAVRIAYFDPARGIYALAETAALPIKVEAAHAVTAFDAEGRDESTLRRALEKEEAPFQSIRTGSNLLADQRGRLFGWGGVLFWLLALAIPPVPFLWIVIRREYIRRTSIHPDTLRARHAHSAFRKRMAGAPVPRGEQREAAYSGIEHAIRTYLADRLRLSAKTLTYPDAHDPLVKRDVGHTLLARLRRIFDECLAHRFSGGRHEGRAHNEDMREAEETIRDLEEKLR